MKNAILAGLLLATTPAFAQAFELSSPDIEAGAAIPQDFALNAFGCTGENISPAMMWTDPPEGTQSFAVMVHDADANTGGAGFWHWVVVDIPADELGLGQGAGGSAGMPEGARQMATDFGVPGWGGPCPPEADDAHDYDFTVYALPVERLDIPDAATASFTGFVVNQMALGSATFTASYDR